MSNHYELIKQYAGRKPIVENGQGFIDLEDIYVSEDLEWIEIKLFSEVGLFGGIKENIYFFGKEVDKDKVEGRLIINYGKYIDNKDLVNCYVMTKAGTVYAVGENDKILSYNDVVNGKYCNQIINEIEMLD